VVVTVVLCYDFDCMQERLDVGFDPFSGQHGSGKALTPPSSKKNSNDKTSSGEARESL